MPRKALGRLWVLNSQFPFAARHCADIRVRFSKAVRGCIPNSVTVLTRLRANGTFFHKCQERTFHKERVCHAASFRGVGSDPEDWFGGGGSAGWLSDTMSRFIVQRVNDGDSIR